MKKLVLPALIFVAFALYYGFQTCPTFYFWDSAELTAAVLKDGVPHPPGFPLFLILAKFWAALLPLDKAQGLNLFSTFFAALGLSTWYLVIVRTARYVFPNGDRLPGELLSLICVIAMGISFSYSIQAARFEVYSLNFFMFAVLFHLTLLIVESNKNLIILYLLLSIALGLSLGVHILTIALVVPGIFLLLYLNKKAEPLNLILILALAIMIAMPFYLALILLARGNPQLNWGDPSSAGRFFTYFFVREFSVGASSFDPAHLAENISFVSKLLVRQFGALGIVLAAIGLVAVYFKKITLGIALSVLLALNAFSSVFAGDFFYENLDLHGYHVISLGVIALCAAVSLTLLYNFMRVRSRKGKNTGTDVRALVIVVVIALFVFIVPVMDNIFSGDLSGADGRQYAESFLADAPSNAAVFTSYYNTYFCLMAYKAAYDQNNEQAIQCIYNWDHPWGRKQSAALFNSEISIDSDRQSFYRDILNGLIHERPIYIEYDESSRPITKYLFPKGLGYLFILQDTSSLNPNFVDDDISVRLKESSESNQIEEIKNWTLWFNNRGQYFERRGDKSAAQSYFAARDRIAARADLK